MATTFTRDTATSTSTILNKAIMGMALPHDQARDYSTFLQVMGSNAEPNPGLGTSSSVGTFSRSATPTGGALVPNSRGKVNSGALYNFLKQEIENSKLLGFVPKDGKKYGIDGSGDSYADFMTQTAQWESGFRVNAKGDVGRYRGGSNGLFQLSPDDALTYKIQKTPFTIQQLQDPALNARVAVKILEDNVLRDGVMVGQSGPSTFLGASAYWGPHRPNRPSDQRIKITPGKFIPASTAAKDIESDTVQTLSRISTEYKRTLTSPAPVNQRTIFFTSFDGKVISNNLDNRHAFDYFRAFSSQAESMYESVPSSLFDEDSFLSPPSDSLGFFSTNVFPKFTPGVAPAWDFNSFGAIQDNNALIFSKDTWSTSYGGPYMFAGNNVQKVSDNTYMMTVDMSDITQSLHNYNFQNIVRKNQSSDVFGGGDQTQSSQLVGTTDLPSYIDHYNNKSYYLEDFKGLFPNTFEYISYFNTVNDNPGYNPRDYKSKNLEKMEDIYAELNVEGQIIKVDLLLKKYKKPVSNRSIKRSLCLCEGCGEAKDNQEGGETLDTATINKRFLEQGTTRGGLESAKTKGLFSANRGALESAKVKGILNSNLSIFDKAEDKLEQAREAFSLPQQKVAELQAKISQVGINNIPGLQDITSPINDLLGSASGLTSILQTPLNLPNILPSVDAGSFPQIAGLLMNTNWKNLDVGSTVEIAKQLNTILCDFRLPIIGKIEWEDIFDIDIEDFDIGEEFDKFIQGFKKKFDKLFTDLQDKFKNLLPNFFKNLENFFKDIFTCDEKPNVKDSDKKVN